MTIRQIPMTVAREHVWTPTVKDRHPEGDCKCPHPLPSGRIYKAHTGERWEACILCGKLPRRPWR